MKLREYNVFTRRYWHSIAVLTHVSTIKTSKNNFIGMGWSIIQPFVSIAIITFFIGLVLRQPGHVMIGTLVASLPFWQFLTASITGGAGALIVRESILKKCTISRSMFPLADTFMHLHSTFFAFVAMYLLFFLVYPEQTSITIVFLPIVAAPLILSVMVVSIAASFIAPYIRDIQNLLTVLLNSLYWTVPIIYPYSIVPEDKKIFFELNPLFILIRPIQILAIEHYIDVWMVVKAIIVTGITTIFSYLVYLKTNRNVVYYL